MKVKDLIKELQELDGDSDVCIPTGKGGSARVVTQVEMHPNPNGYLPNIILLV